MVGVVIDDEAVEVRPVVVGLVGPAVLLVVRPEASRDWVFRRTPRTGCRPRDGPLGVEVFIVLRTPAAEHPVRNRVWILVGIREHLERGACLAEMLHPVCLPSLVLWKAGITLREVRPVDLEPRLRLVVVLSCRLGISN